MRAKLSVTTLVLVAGAVVAGPRDVRAADDAGGAAPQKPAAKADAKNDSKLPPAGIEWFATWEQGLAEAKRAGKPILLVAAAPHCHEVSGLW